MSMATPFEPEPESTTDGQDTLPEDDRLDDPEVPGDDEDAQLDAMHAREPQGYAPPKPGDGLTADELRSDLAE